MSQSDWVRLALHIGIMLAAALSIGQLFRRLGMPALAGEILGGMILGPTILGRFAPEIYDYLFPPSGVVNTARVAMMRIGMLSFIVTIGLGISTSEFRKVSRKALGVGVVGTFVPLFIGIAVAYGFPQALGINTSNQLALALFIGAILSLSANPIIARILIDLGLFRKEIGRVIMAATLIDDLVGWSLFGVILAEYGPNAKGDGSGFRMLPIVVLFVIAVIGFGRLVFPHILRYVQRTFPPNQGLIGAIMVFVLFAAAGSEAMGMHHFLGAFLAGISMADLYDEFQDTFDTIQSFTLSYITPVFFLSMGINADFIKGFSLPMVLVVTIAAFFGKILGVFAGGKMVGMSSLEALAVGCGLNARGILGMVMAVVALEQKLIDQTMYVACVLMCLLTTMAAGPALSFLVKRHPSVATGGRAEPEPT